MWLLGVGQPDYPRLDDVGLVYGRALMLVTHFEQACRDFSRLMNLVNVLDEDPTLNLEAAIKRLPSDSQLKRTSDRIASLIGAPPEVLGVLGHAIEGRNYIAHEAARQPPLYLPRRGVLRDALDRTADGTAADRVLAIAELVPHFEALRPHVTAVAAGDGLVSGWLYEFHEHKSVPATRPSTYAYRVEGWIFEPVLDLMTTEQAEDEVT